MTHLYVCTYICVFLCRCVLVKEGGTRMPERLGPCGWHQEPSSLWWADDWSLYLSVCMCTTDPREREKVLSDVKVQLSPVWDNWGLGRNERNNAVNLAESQWNTWLNVNVHLLFTWIWWAVFWFECPLYPVKSVKQEKSAKCHFFSPHDTDWHVHLINLMLMYFMSNQGKRWTKSCYFCESTYNF